MGETLEDSKLEVTLDVASVDTSNEGRDLTVAGEFTLRGTAKPLTLNIDFAGVVDGPMGATRTGGEATAELSRKEFGFTWNAALEAGGVLAAHKVSLQIDAEFVKADA